MTQDIHTIIWDLDGTLMDTLEDLTISTNHALRECGMPERTIGEVRQFVGNGVRKLMERAVPEGTAADMFEHCFDVFKAHYMVHCQDHTGLYPGIAETLRELKARGLRMAVVSNKLQSGVDELYRQFFADTIDVAIGEREGMQRKPAPDMVQLALQQLGTTREGAVYIGDSDVDVLTARNSQLSCISVLWGFRDEAFLREHGATCFAARPQDIVQMVSLIDTETENSTISN